MNLANQIDLIAEHIGDDQPNLPEGAKNSLLLAAKALRELPVTADGVPVVPHQTVYSRGCIPVSWSGGPRQVASQYYSTPQAAEKASKA